MMGLMKHSAELVYLALLNHQHHINNRQNGEDIAYIKPKHPHRLGVLLFV